MDIRNIFANGQYLRAADMKGTPATLTISSAEVRNMAPAGRPEDRKPVLQFSNTEKEFPCNKTNSNKIAEALGWETDNWAGHRITLQPSVTSYNGQEVPCVRVVQAVIQTNGSAAAIAPAAPAPTPTHDPANGEVPEEQIPF